MQFRTDISFLRAISVLIVMLFHFQIELFSGGFIGVDVFFVISGFLMSQIILKKINSENFSLKHFYLKRVDRIIPPLQFVLFFVLISSAILFFKSDLQQNAKYTFLADFFVSNIYFWKYVDYFSSPDNILLHTWSLGVEWQFYLIYPLIILSLKSVFKSNIKTFWILISILTVLSFAVTLYSTQHDNNFAFYMLPSRFWELSVGGFAYLIGTKITLNNFIQKTIVLLSVAGILSCAVLISEKNLWPSVYTLIPVFCTVAILSLNCNFRIFDNKVTLFFGNISYSLYLWHWPWFIIFKYFGLIGGEYVLGLITVSILCAYVSYRFIEKNKNLSNTRFALISTIIVAILSFIIFLKPSISGSISIYQNKKFEIANYGNKYIGAKKNFQFNPCNCFISNLQTTDNYDFKNCLKFSMDKKNVLLLGDSHSAQFSSSFRELSDINVLEANAGYVFPFPGSNGKKNTKVLMNYIFEDFIPKNYSKIDLVIISAHWLMKSNSNLNYDDTELRNEILEDLKYLNKYHLKYVFLGQTETYHLTYPKILMLKKFGRNDSDFLDIEARKMNEMLKEIIPKDNYLELYDNKQILKFDSARQIPYMFDNNHLSKFGADQVIKKIVYPYINNKL